MDWIGILQNLGFFAILTTALGFIAKSFFGHILKRQIEKFKHRLEMRAFEHKVRFSRLHEKRANIIAELYGKMYYARYALADLIKAFVPAGDLTEIERDKKTVIAFNDFIHYYGEKEIFLSEKTCSLINQFISENKEVISTFRQKDFTRENMPSIEKWNSALDKFKEIEKNVKVELKRDFRTLLGVNDKKSSS